MWALYTICTAGFQGYIILLVMARKTASDFFEKEESLKTEEVAVVEEQENNKSSAEDKNIKTENIINEKEPVEQEEQEVSVPTLVNESHNTLLTPEQEAQAQAYYAQYAQYMQQYQQYYAQYYPNVSTNSSVNTTANFVDPAYDYYSSSGYSAASSSNPAASFESGRASRQMTAYFDPTKFQAVLSPEMQAAQRAQKEQQQARLTAKDIEAFKKRKIEKKKGKNRWFYE